MEGGFKSPRPPAPRVRSRGPSMSRNAANRAGQTQEQQHPLPGTEQDQDSLFGVGATSISNADTGDLPSSSFPRDGLSSASVLARLESLLVAKSNEIQLAGRLGEALLTQQAELESKIRELEEEVQGETRSGGARAGAGAAAGVVSGGGETSEDEVSNAISEEVKQKLQALEAELKSWQKGNNEIYKIIGLSNGDRDAPPSSSHGIAKQPSAASMRRPSTPPPPLPDNAAAYTAEHATPNANNPTSPAAMRRQRNAQHRANDIEFATEIGQSLLIEVRRLQALLSERDAQLAASRSEKDSMERSMESLAGGLKSVEEQLDKYREENWNLEVQNQEIRTNLSDLSGNLTKVESERARLAKELSTTRDGLDSQKLDNERLTNQLESLTSKHETDMANMRRTNAGLQREKMDLQTLVESTKTELALRERSIKRSTSAASGVHAMITGGSGSDGHTLEGEDMDEDDVFGPGRRGTLGARRKTGDGLLDSPGAFSEDGSPARGAEQLSETDKLRATLAHAQKSIQTLKSALAREKEAKMQLKKKLVGTGTVQPADLESEDDEDQLSEPEDPIKDDYEVDENHPEKRKRGAHIARRGGRGRGGRGVLVPRRGSLVGRMPRGGVPSKLSSEVGTAASEDGESEAYIEASIVDHEGDVSLGSEQEELASDRGPSDSFAYDDERAALRASQNSLAALDPAFAQIGEELPHSASAASISSTARQASLGSLMKEGRPTSAMFASDFHIADHFGAREVVQPKETREIGIMTDAEEAQSAPIPTPAPVPAPAPEVTKVETQEISMQTDPEAPIETKAFSMQTEPEARPETIATSVQTEAVSIIQTQPISVQTDPEQVRETKPIAVQTEPEVLKETKAVFMQTEPEASKESKTVSLQTDVEEPRESTAISVQTDPESAKVGKAISMQTESEPLKTSNAIPTQTEARPAQSTAISTMTDAEPVTEVRKFGSMTEAPVQQEMSVQTDPAVEPMAPLPRSSASVGDISTYSTDEGEDTTVFLSGMAPHGQAQDEGAVTPKLESTPTFPEMVLPHDTSLADIRPPSVAASNADDTSIAASFKSFSRTNTDYDTATETEGDFEDARETLATFDNSHFMSMANASQSTVLRSAIDSDQDSDYGHNVEATPRFPGRSTRRREPTLTREMAVGTSPIAETKHEPVSIPTKPATSEIGIQTDDVPPAEPTQAPEPPSIPTHIVTSPTLPDLASDSVPPTVADKRTSNGTFGNASLVGPVPATTRRTASQPSTGSGTEFAGVSAEPSALPSALSRKSSTSQSSSIDKDGNSAMVVSTPAGLASVKKARSTRSIVPASPITSGPPQEFYKVPATPGPRPSRPTSPPPADLLQRAQTPTLLAPSASMSRKRASTSESASATSASGSAMSGAPMGSMPLHRNESHFGASPAPLPHNRPGQNKPAASTSGHVRSATTPVSSTPTVINEFGTRQGASTPVNQMMRPPSRFESTKKRKEASSVSRASVSSMRSGHSRNLSIASSRTSEAGDDSLPRPGAAGQVKGLTNSSTDPAIITAITQTMIGEFLFKYTRTTFTQQTSEKRHQRFFWIHPYTKTLYWSNSDPGAAGVNQSKAKSVYIAGVRTEKDTNPSPPGLYQTSIIVHTVGREIKLTAPTQERHEMWMTAINYLLARPDVPQGGSSGPNTPSSTKFGSQRSANRSATSFRFRQKSDPMTLGEATGGGGSRDATVVPRNRGRSGTAGKSLYNIETISDTKLTPKPSTKKKSSTGAHTSASTYKRSDTPAADYQHFIAEFGSPRSVRSYGGTHLVGGTGADESMEVIDRRDVLGVDQDGQGNGYEGLENVRACCNGEHDVGRLSVSRKHNHHHHHHHGRQSDKRSSRSNSVASKASRLSSHRLQTPSSERPPLPPNMFLTEDPGSPSLRARTLSSNRQGNTLGNAASSTAKGKARASELHRAASPSPFSSLDQASITELGAMKK